MIVLRLDSFRCDRGVLYVVWQTPRNLDLMPELQTTPSQLLSDRSAPFLHFFLWFALLRGPGPNFFD